MSAARLSAHTRILASDAFEGRAPGTPGETKTVAYISREFAKAGLRPAGDRGGWTQAVAFSRYRIVGPVIANATTKAGDLPLAQGEDLILGAGSRSVAIDRAPLIFAGYGIDAPDKSWDDFKGADLKGKVVIVLANDPDFGLRDGDPEFGLFDGKAINPHGRPGAKQAEALRRGALAVLVIHETAAAGYGWSTARNSVAAPNIELASVAGATGATGWIREDAARRLFAQAGVDFEAARVSAGSKAFTPMALNGATLSISYRVREDDFVSHNVVGRLPGRSRSDEAVLYGAHWDHLGVGSPDARGDRIYNGALDNASGVAVLIELARRYAREPRTERSVYFIAFTAEEFGLLGAEAYVRRPVVPLEKTAGLFNFDGANLKGPTRDISSRGLSVSPLESYVAAAAEAAGRRFAPDPSPEQGYFLRGDQYPFARAGAPALGYASGLDLEAGGRPAGRAWADNFVAQRYHQPSDEWTPDIDLRGAAMDADIYYAAGRALANSGDWPNWRADSPFRAIRDETAQARR